MRRALFLLLAVLAFSAPAQAYDPGAELPNAADEARARDLFRELRCMVCQNQSIDDSNAPLAQDLRALVRERVAAGDSNREIKDFLVARYGEFVLLKPRIEPETILLWATPVFVLLAGGAAVLLAARRRKAAPAEALSDEERQKIQALTAERD